MSRGHVVQILLVEEDDSVWPRVEAFFQHQLALVDARLDLHLRRRLPERAAGLDLVSLDGRGLVPALLERRDLLADLRRTAIVNLHANDPGTTYSNLRLLLGHRKERTSLADGLWVFPQSWMASWFQESLDFPELGLVAGVTPVHRASPDRTWERRSVRSQVFVMASLVPVQG